MSSSDASTAPVRGATARTCVGCRLSRPPRQLLRFHRSREGQVIPAPRRPGGGGRSAYLCPRSACFERAVKRRAFSRAFASSGRVDLDPSRAAAGLWEASLHSLRSEVDLLGRTADNPSEHLGRRGLEQLLSHLAIQPAPSLRVPGKAGAPHHG